jgi:hypothetical protein
VIRYCWASGSISASYSSYNYKSCTGGIYGVPAEEVSSCVALNASILGDNDEFPVGRRYGTFRIGTEPRNGINTENGTMLANNYANEEMLANGSPYAYNAGLDNKDGANVLITTTEATSGNWWKTTAGWGTKFVTSETPWKWDSALKRPVLWFE